MVLNRDLEEVVAERDDVPDAEDVYDQDEEIPLTEIFDSRFVRHYTPFESFDELVAASPSDVETADGLELVVHGEWDEFIDESTDFDDGTELVMAARDHWVAKRLQLI